MKGDSYFMGRDYIILPLDKTHSKVLCKLNDDKTISLLTYPRDTAGYEDDIGLIIAFILKRKSGIVDNPWIRLLSIDSYTQSSAVMVYHDDTNQFFMDPIEGFTQVSIDSISHDNCNTPNVDMIVRFLKTKESQT
jgi:hypothetical protein